MVGKNENDRYDRCKEYHFVEEGLTMKKTMVLLVALLLIGSIPCNAIFKRKVVTSKIYSGKIKKVTISPDKKRM